MLALILSKWKDIVIVLALLGSVYVVYDYIYDRGVNATNSEWEAKITKQEEFRQQQIDTIEQLAKTSIEQTLLSNDKVFKDLKAIQKSIGNKPMTTPECQPSKDFIEIYNQTIERINKK